MNTETDWQAIADQAEQDRDHWIGECQKAEAVIGRAKALAEEWRYKGEFGWGAWQEGQGPDQYGIALDDCSTKLRAALDGGSDD